MIDCMLLDPCQACLADFFMMASYRPSNQFLNLGTIDELGKTVFCFEGLAIKSVHCRIFSSIAGLCSPDALQSHNQRQLSHTNVSPDIALKEANFIPASWSFLSHSLYLKCLPQYLRRMTGSLSLLSQLSCLGLLRETVFNHPI